MRNKDLKMAFNTHRLLITHEAVTIKSATTTAAGSLDDGKIKYDGHT